MGGLGAGLLYCQDASRVAVQQGALLGLGEGEALDKVAPAAAIVRLGGAGVNRAKLCPAYGISRHPRQCAGVCGEVRE